ncbi:MAG: hypothetical protein LBP28_06665, partial [Coriobacteriales bacterium]|nr:hypothetical protein [Coriobacteriales bacterium]
MNSSLVKKTESWRRKTLCALMAALLLVGMTPALSLKAQALEPEDLVQLFSTHLEYYLPFDGNSTSVTQKATAENGVTYEQGKFGQAARFNSQTDYVKLDGITEYPADYSFSVSLWIKDNGSGDPSIFANKDWRSGANPGFIFSTRDGDIKFNANTPGRSRVDYNA